MLIGKDKTWRNKNFRAKWQSALALALAFARPLPFVFVFFVFDFAYRHLQSAIFKSRCGALVSTYPLKQSFANPDLISPGRLHHAFGFGFFSMAALLFSNLRALISKLHATLSIRILS